MIAIRSLWRNKVISLIDLLGMAIGFGIFLTLLGWIRFDTSFDKFHKDIDRMYLLNVRLTMNGGEYTSQRTGGIYHRVLKELFPQVESSCRVSQPYQFELGIPVDEAEAGVSMKFYDENQVVMVDSNFFHYFTFPLLEGDRTVQLGVNAPADGNHTINLKKVETFMISMPSGLKSSSQYCQP